MTTLTAPAPANDTKSSGSSEPPINLFQLGVLFVVRVSYWPCRATNEPAELNLTPDRITRKAIASFGTKDLIDPDRGRKSFSTLEGKARHALARFSQPFPAAGAHFVPWEHVPQLIETLETIRTEFEQATAEFLAAYPQLRQQWQTLHPDVPDAAYPPVWELQRKFSLGWHSFKVRGAADAVGIDDLEHELAQRQLKREQLDALRANLHAECQQFVSDYVRAYRREVAAFCEQVIDAGGQVHGKTLQAIRRRIDRFHAMNIFDDADTAAQLAKLKTQIAGVSGEDLAQQPALAEALHKACELLRKEVLDEAAVSALTGRLKRRVVLE